jgi:hypothetical protein
MAAARATCGAGALPLALTDSAGRRVLLTTAVYRADTTARADANAAH